MDPRPFITVVSGLPRSGTSMMMQMLAAGGMPLLTDGLRAPDEDNPRGYFEFEPVKTVREDPSWVSTAVEKAVKMVTLLLRDLPPAFDYRVILMRRDASEVLASQKAMLNRLGKSGARASDERLKELFTKELQDVPAWMAEQPNFRAILVEHGRCIADPLGTSATVDQFLQGNLIVDAMASVVDQALYRKKTGVSMREY